MKLLSFLLFPLFALNLANAQLPNFEIPIAKDSVMHSNNIKQQNIVFVFMKKSCPYSKLYEQRINDLIQNHPQVLFIIIGDFTFPTQANVIQYHDKQKKIQYTFAATKIPSVFYYSKKQNKHTLHYRGAIDDNPQLATDTRHNYLQDALEKTLQNIELEFTETQPPGCNL